MTLKTDIDLLAADAVILHDIIHNPSGTVATEGGAVKAVAQAVADAEATIVSGANSYLDQCQAETALATAQADTATNQAAYAAASALSAASVVAQDLSAIDQTVFAATLVDCILYDTAKDSDGGAWRQRCAHTSWENETLSGNWLGSAANETAARAITGATTGSYYYDTTALGFYTLDAGSGKTATYRGNVAKFPAKVLITVEAARVVLWDLTQTDCPMWMVFITASGYEYLYTSSLVRARVLNGQLLTVSGGALSWVDFIGDKSRGSLIRVSGAGYRVTLPISGRNNASLAYRIADASLPGLVSNVCSDVAMTVLPNAPVDLATGLPIPTIAVATDGDATYSVSVIKDDGTVVSIASDSTGTAVSVAFEGLALKVIRSDGTVYYWNDVRALTTGASPSATVSASTTPAALGTASKQAKRALSSSTGVTLMRRNQLTLASSMLAYITKDYNSGWMPGDIRGAWLADTTAETLVGTELVTNGDFAADSSANWLNVGNAQNITAAAGALRFESTGGSSIVLRSASNNTVVANMVSGKTYTLSAKLTQTVGAGGATYQLRVYDSTGTVLLGTASITTTTGVSQKVSITFTATSSLYPLLYPWVTTATALADAFELDDLSIRLADVDRSVKAKGLQAFGSLTKAAVASGAALMAYSGFSSANYLKQPYNADLDFGTGDFCIMGWARSDAVAASTQSLVALVGTNGRGIKIGRATSGGVTYPLTPYVHIIGSSSALQIVGGTPNLPQMLAGAWMFVAVVRTGNNFKTYCNGMLCDTTAAAVGDISTLDGELKIGTGFTSTTYEMSAALWRASATVPSAEQIKRIYETERYLFEAGAQCCLAGTSNAVTALDYSDETDLLSVWTATHRSDFHGLVRVASEASAVGTFTCGAAGGGIIVNGGTTGVDVYIPAYNLREELNREAEQMAKFGQNLIAHDFTATASQTTFTLPVGWEIVAVYQQGSIKRETTSWTRSFDGFKWSVVLGTGATVSDWISILAKRV